MMKTLRYLFTHGLPLLALLAMQSCRREGCTDASATNYDDSANDNCCCTYQSGPATGEGTLLFWTNDDALLADCGVVSVLLGNGESSNISSAFTAAPGSCEDTHGGFFALAPGDYTYQYVSTEPDCPLAGGSVTVVEGQCTLHLIL